MLGYGSFKTTFCKKFALVIHFNVHVILIIDTCRMEYFCYASNSAVVRKYFLELISSFLQIEHAQHLTHGSATKFGEQGIVASVQVIDIHDLFSGFVSS